MNRLRVNFVDDRASFVPGESVSGTATWELETDPQSIELRLFWYTTGKGDQDLDVVQRLVFAPNNETLRTSAQFLISTNLQRWLGDRINVEQVNVSSEAGFEHLVTIEIIYTVKATQQRQSVQVQV